MKHPRKTVRTNIREHLGETIWDEAPEPKSARDMQILAVKAADIMLGFVAFIALVGSVWAIGNTLVIIGWPSWLAYALGVLIDLFWLACHIKSWALRYNDDDAAPARRVGKVMLTVAVVANAVHAVLLLGGDASTTDIVIAVLITAGLPAAGKVAMRLTMPNSAAILSADDQKALSAKRSKLKVDLATAMMRKDIVREEMKLAQLTGVQHTIEREDTGVQVRDADLELEADPVQVNLLSLLDPELDQPVQVPEFAQVKAVQPTVQPFGFQAEPATQRTKKAQLVAQVSKMLTHHPDLTPVQVTKELDVSLSSAKRYLTEARKA